MPKLSDTEREVLGQVAIVGIQLVADLIKSARAKGVDLEALLEKARSDNEQSIFDVLGIDPGS